MNLFREPLKRNGSVAIAIVSPTRMILVKDLSKKDPRLKLPAGGIEDGETVIEAACREAWEETGKGVVEGGVAKGIQLNPSEVRVLQGEQRGEKYIPHLCLAQVSEEKFDTHASIAFEENARLEVFEFPRGEVAKLGDDLLKPHRNLLWLVDMALENA